MRILFTEAMCVALACAIAPPSSANLTSDWQWAPAPPAAIQEVGAVMLDDNIYVAGGLGLPGQVGLFSDKQFRFDIPTAAWSEVAPFPVPVHHLQAVTTGGKIYYLGGSRVPR
ncbi:hypothetical protein ACQPW1_29950 [Nocardia sp. CA-128927]|uniref:hypothetical protein n=1 Tax=Nocardia sp. CA-128927 TaxID=3239975 RepID=UPI003D974D0E